MAEFHTNVEKAEARGVFESLNGKAESGNEVLEAES
jgi:hypothetical protein